MEGWEAMEREAGKEVGLAVAAWMLASAAVDVALLAAPGLAEGMAPVVKEGSAVTEKEGGWEEPQGRVAPI